MLQQPWKVVTGLLEKVYGCLRKTQERLNRVFEVCTCARQSNKRRLFGLLFLLCAHLIVPLENVLTLGRATKEDFSVFFFCFALT